MRATKSELTRLAGLQNRRTDESISAARGSSRCADHDAGVVCQLLTLVPARRRAAMGKTGTQVQMQMRMGMGMGERGVDGMERPG